MDEGMKILVKSYIRELEKMGVRVRKKSGAARLPEGRRHAVGKLKKLQCTYNVTLSIHIMKKEFQPVY